MVMGAGATLMEELVVDKRLGLFINHDLAGYEVPVHADIPYQEVVFLDTLDPVISPMKAKGVGELRGRRRDRQCGLQRNRRARAQLSHYPGQAAARLARRELTLAHGPTRSLAHSEASAAGGGEPGDLAEALSAPPSFLAEGSRAAYSRRP